MVRIKGANSDYVYTGNSKEPIKEEKNADPLYLKIFICPNDMPSRIEEPHGGKWCEGTDKDCPKERDKKSGHAMICLHQTEGISLVTPNTVKTKSHSFTVESESGNEVLKVSEERFSIALKPQAGKEVRLEISNTGISMKFGEAEVSITPSGDIELSPQDRREVKIKGNLTVQGNLTVNGNFELPEVTKKSLTEEILKKLQK
jgi:hypothetical protein